MDRTGTVAVHDVPTQRARLGGTTLPDDRSVWDDAGRVDAQPGESRVTDPTDHDAAPVVPVLPVVPVVPVVPNPPASRERIVDAPVLPVASPAPFAPAAPASVEPAHDAAPVDAGTDESARTTGGASVFDVPAAPPIRPTEPAPVLPSARTAPTLSPAPETERIQPAAARVAAPEVPRTRRRPTARHLVLAVLVLAAVLIAGWWWMGRASTSDVPAAARGDAAAPRADAAPVAGESVEPPPLPITVPAFVEPIATPADDTGEVVEPIDVSTDPERAPAPIVAEAPAVDDAPIDEAPVIDEPAIEVVPVEEPATDQPAVQEPAAEEPVVDEPVVDEPVAEEQPAAAEPPADPRRVELTTRNEPCRFGNDCLVVGFSLVGFDTRPGTFVCEFASGSRFEFRFEKSTVGTACMTGGAGDTITVEVEGVRSETAVNG